MRVRRWRIAGLTVALMLLAACGSGSGPEEEDTSAAADSEPPTEASEEPTDSPEAEEPAELIPIKIGLPNANSAFVNLLIAKEAGFFEDHGLDVELVQLASPTIPPALVSGDLQLAANIGSTARAALAGLPVSVVMTTMSGTDYTVTTDVSIETVDDLRGETVITAPPTSTPGVMITWFLAENGLTGDVDVANADDGSARVTLLLAREVNASHLNLDKALRVLEEDPDLHILVGPDEFPRVPFTGLGGANDYIAENPDVVEAAIRASLDAGRMMLDDPEGAAELLAAVLELTPEQAREVVERMAPLVVEDGIPGDELFEGEAEIDSEGRSAEEWKSTYDLTIVRRIAEGG